MGKKFCNFRFLKLNFLTPQRIGFQFKKEVEKKMKALTIQRKLQVEQLELTVREKKMRKISLLFLKWGEEISNLKSLQKKVKGKDCQVLALVG